MQIALFELLGRVEALMRTFAKSVQTSKQFFHYRFCFAAIVFCTHHGENEG
jgi:hypothetical protein